jgi:hypothetical protein
MKSKCPWRANAPVGPRCQGREGFAFTGAQRTPLTGEADGSGAEFSQEGQAVLERQRIVWRPRVWRS